MIRILPHPAWIGAAALVCGAMLPPEASGAVISVAQSRQVSTFAFLDAVPGEEPLRSQETIESDEAGPFSENAVCHVEKGGSFVTALADQESSIGPDGVSAVIQASAAGRLVPPAQGTLGIASSGLIYDFDVDAPTACRIEVDLTATGDGVVDIALKDLGGPYVFRWQLFDTEESLEHEELLPPGSYQLTVGGGGDGATGPNGIGFSFISVDFTMTFPIAASAPAQTAAAADRPLVFPNPARDAATLSFPGRTEGSVEVFDPAGRLIRDLGAAAGAPLVWDTRDANGAPVPAGIYFLRWNGGRGASVTVFR